MQFPTRGLYLITPDAADFDALLETVELVLPHAACLQYRNKHALAAQAREQARALREFTAASSVCFIVNDDPRLARDVDADGVHIGEDDGDIANLRKQMGADFIIGASCYDDASLAHAAVAAGADYVAFGALFPSATKPHARRANATLFTTTRDLGVPRVAIGGITPDNARKAIAAGADLLAVIGGVFDDIDPVAAAHAIASAFD